MIQNVQITNHLGEVLTLVMRNPELSGFFIKGITGLGPCKSIINTTDSPSIDGTFFNSVRISPRNVVFDLGFLDNPGEELSIETIRQQSYRFFPMKKPISIKIVTDNREGTTIGYVESNEPVIFSKEENTIISIMCPSSFFEGDSIITTFTGVTPEFEFPFENLSTTEPLMIMSTLSIDTVKSVFYTGDEATGIFIHVNFTGPVNDLIIYNLNLSQQMAINSAKVIALTGSDFVAGDQLFISTKKGAKSITLIRNGISYNLLNALGVTADWFTVERGDNVFTYTADSGLANMQFTIEHTLLYLGL